MYLYFYFLNRPMKHVIVIVIFAFGLLTAGSLQAQTSTTNSRGGGDAVMPPPPKPGGTEAYTVKKFRDKKGAKKFKREKPLKSKNKYNPKKAAKRNRNRH